VRDQRVEERLAVVLHIAHVAVLQESRIAAVQHPLSALPLVFEASDVRRQQSMQAKGVALCLGECSTLVEPGVQKQLDPVKMGPDHAAV
jgi:hypothetical protein